MAGTAYDEFGRPASEKPPAPRDWPAIIGTIIVALTALGGYAYHVESTLNGLQVTQAQLIEQIRGQQHQLDDAIARNDRHNNVIDGKLDTVTDLVGKTVTNLDDLRRELKR